MAQGLLFHPSSSGSARLALPLCSVHSVPLPVCHFQLRVHCSPFHSRSAPSDRCQTRSSGRGRKAQKHQGITLLLTPKTVVPRVKNCQYRDDACSDVFSVVCQFPALTSIPPADAANCAATPRRACRPRCTASQRWHQRLQLGSGSSFGYSLICTRRQKRMARQRPGSSLQLPGRDFE